MKMSTCTFKETLKCTNAYSFAYLLHIYLMSSKCWPLIRCWGRDIKDSLEGKIEKTECSLRKPWC